jgi:hypothetical protein
VEGHRCYIVKVGVIIFFHITYEAASEKFIKIRLVIIFEAIDAVFYDTFIRKGRLSRFKAFFICGAVRTKGFRCFIINWFGTFSA